MATKRSPNEEYVYRRSFVVGVGYEEAQARLAALFKWLVAEPTTSQIIKSIRDAVDAKSLLPADASRNPPRAGTPEEVAAVGLLLLKEIDEGQEPYALAEKYNISPSHYTSSIQDHFSEVMQRYIDPALDFIGTELDSIEAEKIQNAPQVAFERKGTWFPLEIDYSLKLFMADHPEIDRNSFIMMKFGKTKLHERILSTIRSSLRKYGIEGLRSDDKEYHDDLFPNVQTYVHGCSFGVAVFERLEAEDFNPNVSLEVGYMRGLRKSVCLLKDNTLKTLHTDLAGKLYKEFDPQDPETTIPKAIEKWLHDKDIISL